MSVIPPASKTDAQEEQRASLALGLEYDLGIDNLKRPANARDRKTYNSVQQKLPRIAATLTLDDWVGKRVNGQIVDTVQDFLPAQTSLIGYLGETSLATAAIESVRATPSDYLQTLLTSPRAQALTDKLLQVLAWYGAKPGEQTSPAARTQLLGKAIRLYLNAPSADTPKEIAGYDWQQRDHWGMSYPAIHARFEAHLLTSKRVATANEAVLLARLYQRQLSQDFAIRDVPADLPYRSSVVWVNFMHGVLLAANLAPRLTFQQLVDLPMKLSSDANAKELQTIARARLLPTLQWAVTQGLIPERDNMDYSQVEIETATQALDDHSEALREAVMQLDVPAPDRMAMARQEMAWLFGDEAFIKDGRKLVLDRKSASSGIFNTPNLKNPHVDPFSFLDVYVAGKLGDGRKWLITGNDGRTTHVRWIGIDNERKIQLYRDDVFAHSSREYGFTPRHKVLPDVDAMFEASFKRHLGSIKRAYRTLIISLLASLPLADRQAVERGTIRLLSLRQVAQGVSKKDETAQITLPLRARMGFVLEVTHRQQVSYYEFLPLAGAVQCRTDVNASLVGGTDTKKIYDGGLFGGTSEVTFSGSKRLPFDWSAHAKGKAPRKNQHCNAILDQVGNTLQAPSEQPTENLFTTPALASPRQQEVADFITAHFLYQDEKLLYAAARGRTEFDEISDDIERKLNVIKGFVPFWSSIEDLMSGDKSRLAGGVMGLVLDVASFLYPIGKFVSGSARLIRAATVAGRVTTRATLPGFSTLTRKLLVSSLQNLNPLDGIPTLLKSIVTGGGKLVVFLGKKGWKAVTALAGRTDSYSFVKGLPQAMEPGRWKPLAEGDQLATVRGIDDVPVRNVATSDGPGLYLVDPHSAKAYGPRLSTSASAYSPGRSAYSSVEKTDRHVIVELSEKSQVREVFEVDGRTTMFIDDVAYRLEADALRRADLMTSDDTLKALPCRVRRALGGAGICETRYVMRTPAQTPDIGSFDESKGWASWFGDSIYTPATGRSPMAARAIANYATLQGTMAFQKGIYGRVKISLPVPGQPLTDTYQVGAIVVEAKDGAKHYVFTRLNAGDFYVAERLNGQSMTDPLTFRKAATLAVDVRKELEVVYTGSLNANNMARIYGVEAVERALKTMEEIAIPIGSHANPPDTLKWLKVDTSPGEAALFDHSTRMIISKQSTGASAWSRSQEASEALRLKVAEIFDTLFLSPTIDPKSAPAALRINSAMQKLHSRLPWWERGNNARNIAFADVTNASGKREVYVSVSGGQRTTTRLPLFRHLGANHVRIGDTTYINVDYSLTAPRTGLDLTDNGRFLAVPLTIKDIEKYQPAMTSRPTALDSESKLIRVLREKYPDPKELASVEIATTMPPCESCSVVMKEFGHNGGADALNVLWS